MSQFPQNQNPLIEYRGRQVFEQPVKPGVYQEQMPILPTPSFNIGYTGINYAEIGEMAAKAGTNIANTLAEYDVQKKGQALESIFTESKNKLDNLYSNGGSKEELDAERASTNTKVAAALGFDPSDPNTKEENYGVKYGNLLVAARKGMSSIDSSNSRYVENTRTNQFVENAALAAIQVDEELSKDPTNLKAYDQGIESINRILETILGKGVTPNSDTIQAIKNPGDKDAALKAYATLVKLKSDKLKTEAGIAKDLLDNEKDRKAAEKDLLEQEKDQRKRENGVLRDTLTYYASEFKSLKEKIKFIQDVPLEQRTAEQDATLANLINTYLELKTQAEGEFKGFSVNRYGNLAITDRELWGFLATDIKVEELPFSSSSDFFKRQVIGDAAVDDPPVRTAFGTFLDEQNGVEESIGRVRLTTIKQAQDEAKKVISSRWKGISAELNKDIAIADSSNNLDASRPALLARLERFNSSTLDTIMGYMGTTKIKEHYDNLEGKTIRLSNGELCKVGSFEEEEKQNFPSLKFLLDLNTPPEQESIIANLFEGNSTAYDSWKEASVEFKQLQAKLFKAADSTTGRTAAMREQEDLREGINVLLGTRSVNPKVTTGLITKASDYLVSNTYKNMDQGDFSSVKAKALEVSASNNPQYVDLNAMIPSRMFATAYQGAESDSEFVTTVSSFLPKDDKGQPITYKPSPWPDTMSSASFPVVDLIVADLNNADPRSDKYKKAVTAFGLMPESWRTQIIGRVNKDIILEDLDRTLKENPGMNIKTAISTATRGSYGLEVIQEASKLADGVVNGAFGSYDFTQPRPTETPDQVAFRTKVVNALIEAVSKHKFSNGFVSSDSLDAYKFTADARMKLGFKDMLYRATKYYELYKIDRPQTALNEAIADSMKEFERLYVVEPRGLAKAGAVKSDFVTGINETGTAPDGIASPSRLFQNQGTNSALLDQDFPQYLIDTTKAKGNDKHIPTFGVKDDTILTKDKAKIWTEAVVSAQNKNGGISSSTRKQLMRLRFNEQDQTETNERSMFGELIDATRVGTDTTTRRDLMVSVGVLKEIEMAMQDPNTRFTSFEDVLSFAKNSATKIRKALKESKDSPSKTSPYTIQFTSSGKIKNTNGELEQSYTLELLKKEDTGAYTRLVGIQEGFESGGYPTYTVRGNSSNIEVLSSIGDRELYEKSTEYLIPKIQALYDKGLLVGNFKYRILKPYGNETSFVVSNSVDFENNKSNSKYIPTIIIEQDPETKKISIRRQFQESPYSSTWEMSKSFWKPGHVQSYSDTVLENTSQFTEEESNIKREEALLPVEEVKKEELSADTIRFMGSVQNLAYDAFKVGYKRPWQNAFRTPTEGKLTVVDPTASIESTLQFPELIVTGNNKVRTKIVYNYKDDLYFVVPNPYDSVEGYTDGMKHLGGFVNIQDAQYYTQALESFMKEKRNITKPNYGLRDDGTQKGYGWLGPLKTPKGNIVTEFSINVDGIEMPTIVPTLTSSEVKKILEIADLQEEGQKVDIPKSIVEKAIKHAKEQITKKKSPFLNEDSSLKSAISPIRNTSEISTVRGNTEFRIFDVKSPRDYYESVYGPEITKELFRQASDEQQKNSDRYINGIPMQRRFPNFSSYWDAFNETVDRRVYEKYNIKKPEIPSGVSDMQQWNMMMDQYNKDYDKYWQAHDMEAELVKKKEEDIGPDLGVIPDYSQHSDMSVPIWVSQDENKDPISTEENAWAIQAKSETSGQQQVYFSNKLINESQDKINSIGLHEFIHMMQREKPDGVYRTMGSQDIFGKQLNPDERYALDSYEIPAWLAQLKAEYYLETNKVLYPKSSEEEYNSFFAWIKSKDDNSDARKKYNVESFYGIFHRMLTNPNDKIRRKMKDVLKQVAFNLPDNFGEAII